MRFTAASIAVLITAAQAGPIRKRDEPEMTTVTLFEQVPVATHTMEREVGGTLTNLVVTEFKDGNPTATTILLANPPTSLGTH